MAVKVKGWKGVAFDILGPAMTVAEIDPEELEGDLEDQLQQVLDMEFVPSEQFVRVRMVGDDKVYEVDKDDCTEISEEDYCHECGQLGCTHDGMDRVVEAKYPVQYLPPGTLDEDKR